MTWNFCQVLILVSLLSIRYVPKVSKWVHSAIDIVLHNICKIWSLVAPFVPSLFTAACPLGLLSSNKDFSGLQIVFAGIYCVIVNTLCNLDRVFFVLFFFYNSYYIGPVEGMNDKVQFLLADITTRVLLKVQCLQRLPASLQLVLMLLRGVCWYFLK